jgi:hypothetical protein
VVFLRKEILVLLGLIVALTMIASCVPVAKYYVCSDGKKVLDASQCTQKPAEQPIETKPVETNPLPEPAKPAHVELTDDAKALFDKMQRLQTLQFYYIESPNILADNHYFMSRDKMEIVFQKKQKLDANTWYDTVYLDLAAKTAAAYCEEKNTAFCPDRNKAVEVDYKTFSIPTPIDWVTSITKANLSGQSKTLFQRQVIGVAFNIGDKAGTMFMDSYFGVPVVVTYDGKTYTYQDLAGNLVDTATLVHQKLTD